MKYIVYQITNKINNMIYIGVHATKNPNDSYMGSGTNIKKAIKEYGIQNFEKIVLYQFDNKEDMLNKEKELVNKFFISNTNTYNIILGGGQFNVTDTVAVKDINGKTMQVHKTDPRYLSGELKHINIGFVTVKDKTGKTFRIDINDHRYLSGELKHISLGLLTAKDKNNKILYVHKTDPRLLTGELVGNTKGTITVKDKNNKFYKVALDDERYLNGELKHINTLKSHVQDKNGNKYTVSSNDPRLLNGELFGYTKNMITVKDKNENIFNIFKDDDRYINGELVPIWKDKKHSLETKQKMSEKAKLRKHSPTKGMFWITEITTNNKKMIKPDELEYYLNIGWKQNKK